MSGLDKTLFRNTGIFIIISFMIFLLASGNNKDNEAFADENRSGDTLQSLEDSYRILADESSRTIVEVRVSNSSPVADSRFFYGLPGESQTPSEEEKNYGIGSGVLIEENHPEYLIITNYHVAGTAEEIRVILNDGRKYKAERLGIDPRKDLCLLKIKINSPEVLKIASIGDSDLVMKGDWVLVAGSPYEFSSSVSTGIISSKNRMKGPEGNINDFLQTDAAINQGNSGGGLFDIRGNLIGINTWIAASSGGGNIGLGFSIPSNNIIKTIDDIQEYGEVRYGWIGISVHLSDILNGFDKYFIDDKFFPDDGIFVDQIFFNTPAAEAGILPGDTIIKVNGKSVSHKKTLSLLVGDTNPGQNLNIDLIKTSGKKRNISLKTELREESVLKSLYARAWPGVYLIPLTPTIKKLLNLKSELQEGLLVESVIPRSAAQSSGLVDGDIIVEVNGKKTSDYKEFYFELSKSDIIIFKYSRQGQIYNSEEIDLKEIRSSIHE